MAWQEPCSARRQLVWDRAGIQSISPDDGPKNLTRTAPVLDCPPQTPNSSTAKGGGQHIPEASKRPVQHRPKKSMALPCVPHAPQASRPTPGGQHSPMLLSIDPTGQQLPEPATSAANSMLVQHKRFSWLLHQILDGEWKAEGYHDPKASVPWDIAISKGNAYMRVPIFKLTRLCK